MYEHSFLGNQRDCVTWDYANVIEKSPKADYCQ